MKHKERFIYIIIIVILILFLILYKGIDISVFKKINNSINNSNLFSEKEVNQEEKSFIELANEKGYPKGRDLTGGEAIELCKLRCGKQEIRSWDNTFNPLYKVIQCKCKDIGTNSTNINNYLIDIETLEDISIEELQLRVDLFKVQEPIQEDNPTSTTENNTTIAPPEQQGYSDLDIQNIWACMECGKLEEDIYSQCGESSREDSLGTYWVGNDLTIKVNWVKNPPMVGTKNLYNYSIPSGTAPPKIGGVECGY